MRSTVTKGLKSNSSIVRRVTMPKVPSEPPAASISSFPSGSVLEATFRVPSASTISISETVCSNRPYL